METRLYHVAFTSPSTGFTGDLRYRSGSKGMGESDLDAIKNHIRSQYAAETVIITFFGELAE